MFLADIVEPVAEPDKTLRDRTDWPILGTLRAAHADYLIIGDKDLLSLAERYPIISPASSGTPLHLAECLPENASTPGCKKILRTNQFQERF